MAVTSDKQWQAEMDARTIASADAIKGDPTRLGAAQTAAKKIVKQEQQAAKDAKTRAAGMAKLAKKAPAKKAPAKKAAAKKRK